MANLCITNEFFPSAFKQEQFSSTLKNERTLNSISFHFLLRLNPLLRDQTVCPLLHTLQSGMAGWCSPPHPSTTKTALPQVPNGLCVAQSKAQISVFPWFPQRLAHLFGPFLFAQSVLVFFAGSTLCLSSNTDVL